MTITWNQFWGPTGAMTVLHDETKPLVAIIGASPKSLQHIFDLRVSPVHYVGVRGSENEAMALAELVVRTEVAGA